MVHPDFPVLMPKEVTVQREQALYLAQKLSVCHAAEKEFKEALWLLSLGRDVESMALLDINTGTGVLTFSPEGAALTLTQHDHGNV